MFALLAASRDVPLRQDLAVTGSVNQHGEMQPIGGVNEKIEGFFDVCAARGLTGAQGCSDSAPNLPDLMLRPAVVGRSRRGSFHIYAIRTVGEGIQILSGVVAGERGDDGRWTPGSVFARVDERLRGFITAMKEAAAGTEDGTAHGA